MYILDIEASGLSDDSYPIEIAWQHRFNSTLFDTFLIRPISTWTHWDSYAEQHVHRIRRAELMNDGIDVVHAAQRLNEHLANQVTYSDCVEKDAFWLSRLYQAANMEPSFEIRSVMSLLPPEKEMNFCIKATSQPVQHRALADVRGIIKVLNFITPE